MQISPAHQHLTATSRPPWFLAALCSGLLLVACANDEQTVGASSPSTATVPAMCKADADCPAAKDPCMTAVCKAGQCEAKAKAVGDACDDKNVCNGTADKCTATGCVGSGSMTCDDGDACTADGCDPLQGCYFTATPSKCDDANPCTVDTCAAKDGCKHTPAEMGVCDDNNPCTVGDNCKAGKCAAGPAAVCDDGNVCTTDSCDPAFGCTAKNNTAGCDDGDACSKGDACADGLCRPGKTAVSCDDGNACTQDLCDPKAGCKSKAVDGLPCDDGSQCTDGDLCQAGKCASGKAIDCDDKDNCSDDACDAKTGCGHVQNTASCSDGDACTSGDACTAGKCQGKGAVLCDDGNACTVDLCNPASGCGMALGVTVCDDGNACTGPDNCAGAVCKAGAATSCDDKNPCTDDSCDPKKGCQHSNNTAVCDDGKVDTAGDACMGGVCMGMPVAVTPTCASLCDKVQAACGNNGANAQFASAAECLTWCATQAKVPTGTAADKSGNTIGCRMYHAGLAATPGMAATHCPHAGKSGGNVCGTWCDNYCHLAKTNCASQLGYASDAACQSACSGAPLGTTTGYTVQCMLEAGVAAAADATQCTAMTVVSGGLGMCKAPKTVAVVTTNSFTFDPSETTISVGDSVEFTTAAIHNVQEVDKATWTANGNTALPGGFSVGFGATKAVQFKKAGTYYYVCSPHASSGMKGVIVVQ